MIRRNTVQKSMVYDAVAMLANHPTAEEIYTCVSNRYPSIGKGTVYRNLGLLVEDGKLLKIDVPDGPAHYDHTVHTHYHVHCCKCGKLVDVTMNATGDLKNLIVDTGGFQIADYSILFNGICPNCQNKDMEEN